MDITNLPLPDPFNQRVRLQAEAQVGGERLVAEVIVLQAVYDDPEARRHIIQALERELMNRILEKWSPVITVHR